MKKIKSIGFWKEFRIKGSYSVYESIDPERLLTENSPNLVVINYMDSAYKIDEGVRSILYCPITGEEIGSYFIATDGEWIWTSEYIYYLREGLLDIHADFYKHIEKNNFECPAKNTFELNHIKNIEWFMEMPVKEMYVNSKMTDKVIEIFEFY